MFSTIQIIEFNKEQGTNLHKGMSFDEAINEIEANNISYFYTSMDSKDVLEAIKDEQEIADQLDLTNYFIDEIGIFIAIY